MPVAKLYNKIIITSFFYHSLGLAFTAVFSCKIPNKFVIDNTFIFCAFFYSSSVPRKVLLESFDVPMELDEQNQQESDYENELDEDDGHYKEAIPPAPKLQGTIPRSDGNATQSTATKTTTATGDNSSDSVQNQPSFSEGSFIMEILR